MFNGEKMPMDRPVNLVIFSSRENISTISKTISCAIKAVPDGSFVDVLVNGNQELAEQIDLWVSQNMRFVNHLSIWYIPLSDKGNAWNQHIHKIWRNNMNSIYMDGYVRLSRNDICALSETLRCKKSALGTSGVPTVGKSAKVIRQTMHKDGGFHGNLCAIKLEALNQLRDRNIRIPLGMYRVDSIMGAYLSFNLDNKIFAWDPHQYLPVTSTATWENEEKKWYRWRDVFAWIKRRNRQAKGKFENAAVKYHLTDLKC